MSRIEARRLVERCVRELAVPRELRAQAADFVDDVSDGFGSIRITPKSRASVADLGGPLVEGEALDADGQDVFAVLLVSAGRLAELQIYRGDGLAIRGELLASGFKLFPGMVLSYLARTKTVPLVPPLPEPPVVSEP
ncbi:MAG: DUF6984 family protein [Agromyces sp.]